MGKWTISRENRDDCSTWVQARLARYWGNYLESSQQRGEVYIGTPCRTVGQGRRPDVAYLTPELVAQHGNFNSLPQSFSLIAEVISPADLAEQVFVKVKEYLQSGCEEVWLIFPESELIFVITEERQILFKMGEVAGTQKVLTGFNVAVDHLLA